MVPITILFRIPRSLLYIFWKVHDILEGDVVQFRSNLQNISDEPPDSVFRVEEWSWRWKQQVSPKYSCHFTTLHGFTFKKTTVLTITTVRTTAFPILKANVPRRQMHAVNWYDRFNTVNAVLSKWHLFSPSQPCEIWGYQDGEECHVPVSDPM
jgi:hypothetical protein